MPLPREALGGSGPTRPTRGRNQGSPTASSSSISLRTSRLVKVSLWRACGPTLTTLSRPTRDALGGFGAPAPRSRSETPRRSSCSIVTPYGRRGLDKERSFIDDTCVQNSPGSPRPERRSRSLPLRHPTSWDPASGDAHVTSGPIRKRAPGARPRRRTKGAPRRSPRRRPPRERFGRHHLACRPPRGPEHAVATRTRPGRCRPLADTARAGPRPRRGSRGGKDRSWRRTRARPRVRVPIPPARSRPWAPANPQSASLSPLP